MPKVPTAAESTPSTKPVAKAAKAPPVSTKPAAKAAKAPAKKAPVAKPEPVEERQPEFHQYKHSVDGGIYDLDSTSFMAKNPTVDQIIASPYRGTAEYLRRLGYPDEAILADYRKAFDKALNPKATVIKEDSTDHETMTSNAWKKEPVESLVKLEQMRARELGATREELMAINATNVHDLIQSRLSGKDKKAAALTKLKEKAAAEPKVVELRPVANTVDIKVECTEGGRYFIEGKPVTAIFRYCGSAGWTHEQAMTLVKSLGLADKVSESTARIQMNAGKKGGDCGGRGPVPTLSPEVIAKFDAASGRGAVAPPAPPAKPAPAPKGKGKKSSQPGLDAQVANDEAILDAKRKAK